MNCPEFIGMLKSGQPVLLRRHSKEYIRLTENSLSVIAESGVHTCLWLAANRKFKRILATFSTPIVVDSGLFRETVRFLNRWKEIQEARDWSPVNFPGLHEIATFVYMTLIPEYWTIYLEVEGKLPEEALPVIEHESIHSDSSGYDF